VKIVFRTEQKTLLVTRFLIPLPHSLCTKFILRNYFSSTRRVDKTKLICSPEYLPDDDLYWSKHGGSLLSTTGTAMCAVI
jgi:hypothetical protein